MDPDAHFDGVTGATILPNERLPSRGPDGHAGGRARNAFHEPDSFIVGSHGDVGGNDPMNTVGGQRGGVPNL